MKFYIELATDQFITQADSPDEAIAMLWMRDIRAAGSKGATGPNVESQYLVHLGRIDEASFVSSGASYWLLPCKWRPVIRRWIEQESSPELYDEFCCDVVAAFHEENLNDG